MQMYDEDVVCFFVNKLTPKNKQKFIDDTREYFGLFMCPKWGTKTMYPKWGTNRVHNGVQNGVQR